LKQKKIVLTIFKQEITRILSEKLTSDDEEDIASELDKLETAMAADSLAQVQVPQANIPTKTKKPEENAEEEEEESSKYFFTNTNFTDTFLAKRVAVAV